MRHRLIPLFALFAVSVLPLVVWAQPRPLDPLKFDQPVSTTHATTPGALNDRSVTVVLKMAAEPVALLRAQFEDKAIAPEAEAEAVAGMQAEQALAEPYVAAAGGKVLAHYYHAINGIKVEIAPSELPYLADIPGVVAVLPVPRVKLDNATSVPFIGAPNVWGMVPGYRGEAIKIAVIDTGVDYTHADFGGPGTTAAWTQAFANSTQPANPTMFGPKAPKVKGGWDFVGDNYDADGEADQQVPHPDPNPLDCAGHGTHVAGTAVGFGVLINGATFKGPWNSAAYTGSPFAVGPGVAPKADLYSLRVFGCSGSTVMTVDAINWAVKNRMDVIGMSLGSPFGLATSADAEAASNAAKAGITVVASAGNSGPQPYVNGSPGVGDRVISVAAMDAIGTRPGAKLGLAPGGTILVQNSNGAAFSDGAKLTVVVLRNQNGSVSFGCSESEYVDSVIKGKLVVALRGGSCARVFRPGAGQKHGAAAVALINNSAGYPPYEYDIGGGDPTTNPFDPVTIPFFGVLAGNATVLAAASKEIAYNAKVGNAGFELTASFSSSGPVQGTSAVKPSLAAPGVEIMSAGMGTGTGGVRMSGTSMAAPLITGVAALVKQAHPKWTEVERRMAIIETSTPSQMQDYEVRMDGAGVVQPMQAVMTQSVVLGSSSNMTGLSFGEAEMTGAFTKSLSLTLVNHGPKPVTFDLSSAQLSGAGPAKVTFDTSSVSVPANGQQGFEVTLNVPATSVGPTHDPKTGNLLFQEISGLVTFKPAESTENNGVSLHLPYYLVPRVRSNVGATSTLSIGPDHPASALKITNASGAIAGTPDFYSLGNYVAKPSGISYFDPRATGVQTWPMNQTTNTLVFALNTWTRFNNPAAHTVYICIFTKSPPSPCLQNSSDQVDYVVVGWGDPDFGYSMVATVYNPTNQTFVTRYLADAPTDGSTVLLPVWTSDLGLSPAAPYFAYTTQVWNENGQVVQLPGVGHFNAFKPALNVAQSPAVAPGKSAQVKVTVDPTEWKAAPPSGLMVVVPDNRAGQTQAQIIPVE